MNRQWTPSYVSRQLRSCVTSFPLMTVIVGTPALVHDHASPQSTCPSSVLSLRTFNTSTRFDIIFFSSFFSYYYIHVLLLLLLLVCFLQSFISYSPIFPPSPPPFPPSPSPSPSLRVLMAGMTWWTHSTATLSSDGQSSSKMENLPLMQRLVAVLLYFNNLKWFSPCSQDTEGQLLGPVSTRNLLFCFLWVLKNIDSSLLQQWWYTLSIGRCGRLCACFCLSYTVTINCVCFI